MTLSELKTRILKRLDDEEGVFWPELTSLINEALLTWEAFANYSIKEKRFPVSETSYQFEQTIPTLTPEEQISTVLFETPSTEQYHSEQIPIAILNSFREWQQQAKLIISVRELDQGAGFIKLGLDHIAPIHIDWMARARKFNRRLDPMDPQDLTWFVEGAGKPFAYGVHSREINQIQLFPKPDELGSIEIWEAATTNQIPRVFSWVIKYLSLYQMLSVDGQARDEARAEYCKKRVEDAIQLATRFPWFRNAVLNEVPIQVCSLADLTSWDSQWRFKIGVPKFLVMAGWNKFFLYPKPHDQFIGELLIEAYEPPKEVSLADDVIYLPKEFHRVLEDFVIHLALFKCSGLEFAHTLNAYKELIETAMGYNVKLYPLQKYLSISKSKSTIEKQERKQEFEGGTENG